MGPFRKILSVIVGWGLLMGPFSLPASAQPAWTQRTPAPSGDSIWLVGRSFDASSLTKARQEAQDGAFDDLMTLVGVGGMGALQQLDGSIGEAYRHISEMGSVSLRQADEFVRRRGDAQGTRYDLWVLYTVPQTRFTELKERWRTAGDPGADPYKVWAQAHGEARRQAVRDYWKNKDEETTRRIRERRARETEKLVEEAPLRILLIVLVLSSLLFLPR